ncbi:MAG: A/G-specific adenine glycosylase [Puniceicoccaceae bacterium]
MREEDFSQRLLDWFGREGRALPWREKRSLYGTVVSEFMLQQTQVKTVLPYYARWMATFPGFRELAEAEEEAVLAAWAGLGYYSRAKNLQRLARELVRRGEPPVEVGEWQQLPGIGPYTAAAVVSMVFGGRVAVVDGNVVRVLSRFFGIREVFAAGNSRPKSIVALAERLLDADRPGEYNEALMDLGATICTPRKPRCLLCPLKETCAVGGGPEAEELPRLERVKTVELEASRLCWIQDGRIWLRRREGGRRLLGMYELPELAEGVKGRGANLILKRRRGISNQRILEHLYCFFGYNAPDEEMVGEGEWLSLAGLDSFPVVGPHRRWIGELRQQAEGGGPAEARKLS